MLPSPTFQTRRLSSYVYHSHYFLEYVVRVWVGNLHCLNCDTCDSWD